MMKPEIWLKSDENQTRKELILFWVMPESGIKNPTIYIHKDVENEHNGVYDYSIMCVSFQ